MHATEKLGGGGEEGDVQRADANEEKGVHFFKNSKFLQGCPDCPTGLSFKFDAHKLVAAEMGFSSGETNRYTLTCCFRSFICSLFFRFSSAAIIAVRQYIK